MTDIFDKKFLLMNKKYTLTISKPSGATVTLTYNGNTVTYSAPLKIKKGTTVNYTVTQSNTTTKSGSFTMNSNKTLTVSRESSTTYGNYVLNSMWSNNGAPFNTSTGYLGTFSSSAYVESSSTPDNFMSTSSWTVSISFKITSTSGNNTILGGSIFGLTTGGYNYHNLTINADGTTLKVLWGGTTIASGTISASSSFKTITVTKNSSGYTVSGAISGTKSSTSASNWSSSYNLFLGRRSAGGVNASNLYGTAITIDTANSYITTTSGTKYFSSRTSSTTYYFTVTIS